MRKTNRNIKRAKFFLRVAIAQLIILVFGFILICSSAPIEADECIQENIIVEDKRFISRIKGGSYIKLYCNEKTYQISILPVGTAISDVYEMIDIGDRIEILYSSRFVLFRSVNLIVDVKGSSELNLNIHSVNENLRHSQLIGIIVFVVVEVIYVAFVLFVIKFWGTNKKTKSKRN